MIRQKHKPVREILSDRMTSEPIDDTVKVWIDESLLNNNQLDSMKQDVHQNEEVKDEQISTNKMSEQAFNAQLARDERIMKLKAAIDKEEVKKYEDALKLLDVSRRTVDSYLKELGYALYDSNKKVHGINPKMISNFNSVNRLRGKNKMVYFDGDPNDEKSEEISFEEHKQKVEIIKNGDKDEEE